MTQSILVSFFRRKQILVVISIITIIYFKTYIFNFFIEYKVYDISLPKYKVENVEFEKVINDYCDSKEILSIYDVVSTSLTITSQVLTFSSSTKSNNPNILTESKNAHCVGYANYFSTVCNYLLSNYEINSDWVAIPKRGQIYFCGFNIHNYLGSSTFVKDHDFVCIKNISSNELCLWVDPSLYNFTYINYISIK